MKRVVASMSATSNPVRSSTAYPAPAEPPRPPRRTIVLIVAAVLVVAAAVVTVVLTIGRDDQAGAPITPNNAFGQYVDPSIAGASNLTTFLDQQAFPDFMSKVQPAGDGLRCFYVIKRDINRTLGNIACGTPGGAWWSAGTDLVDGALTLESNRNPDVTVGRTWIPADGPDSDPFGIRPDGEMLPSS